MNTAMHCIVGLNELKLAAIVDEVLATRAVVKVRGCGGCSGRRRLRLRRRRGHCCRRHRMLVAQRRLVFMFIFVLIKEFLLFSFTCLTNIVIYIVFLAAYIGNTHVLAHHLFTLFS